MDSLLSMGFPEDVAVLAVTDSEHLDEQVETAMFLNDFCKKPRRLLQGEGFVYTFIGSMVEYDHNFAVVKDYDPSIESVCIQSYTESPWHRQWVALHDPLLEFRHIKHNSRIVPKIPTVLWKRSLGRIKLPMNIFEYIHDIEIQWKYHHMARFPNYASPIWHAIYKCTSNEPHQFRITPSGPEKVAAIHTSSIFWKRNEVKSKLELFCCKYKKTFDEMVRSQDFMTAADKEQFMKLLNYFTDTRRYMVEERDAWESQCVPFLYMQFIEINNEYATCELFIHNESFHIKDQSVYRYLKYIQVYMQDLPSARIAEEMTQTLLLQSMNQRSKMLKDVPEGLQRHQALAYSWMVKRETKAKTPMNHIGYFKKSWSDGFTCYESIWGEYLQNLPGSYDVHGGILALPIGSGKTAVCCHLVQNYPGKTLILCPKTLVSVWQEEFKKHADKTETSVFAARKKITGQVVIASYNNVNYSLQRLKDIRWSRIICDEIHTFKNSTCNTIKGIAEIPATNRWCVTATPVQEPIHAIESLMCTLRIPIFLKNKRLVKQIQEIKDPRVKYEMYENVYHLLGKISYYKKSIFEYSVNYSVAEVVMPSEWRVLYNAFITENEFRKSSRAFFMNMRSMTNHPSLVPLYRYGSLTDSDCVEMANRDDLLLSLTDSSSFEKDVKETIVHGGKCCICLDDLVCPTITDCKHIFCKECIQQNYEYRKECPQCRHPIQKLQEIVTETVEQKDMVTINMNNLRYRVDRKLYNLYQKSMQHHPKIDALIFMLLRSSEKTIVFTNVTKMLSHIECRLMEEKIPFCIIRGTQKASIRAQMIQRFQNDPNIKVFLLTHKTAAEGLTLTAASRIVFMEPCSNKEVFQQSLGRVRRMGQTKTIQCTTIIAKDTIDSVIYQETEAHHKSITDHKKLFHGADCESFAIYRREGNNTT